MTATVGAACAAAIHVDSAVSVQNMGTLPEQ